MRDRRTDITNFYTGVYIYAKSLHNKGEAAALG